jgi:hypothetical protein
MQKLSSLTVAVALAPFALTVLAAPAGPTFYGDPPDDHHPWAIHDANRPKPKTVVPGSFSRPEQAGKPPSDAIILFDGKDLSEWDSNKQGQPPKWVVRDGYMECTQTGDIHTKKQFGDCQLHIEWAAPNKVEGDSQGRGNSGIFLLGRVEIQVLDNYNNPTYADGYAGSVYGVHPAMANALRPPGEFQVYDIVFRRPIYRDGKVLDPGYVTVFMNGVLVQDHAVLEGGTGHMGRSKPGPLPEKGPLQLQDHSNPTRFRNIWYRELPPRAVQGGTDGPLTVEATMAKRAEIAAGIRTDAAQVSGSPGQMLRYMESLVYENHADTLKKVEEMAVAYLKGLSALPADQLAPKKDEVKNVNNSFKYLGKFKLIPADFGPKQEVEKLVKAQGWDKK